MPSSRPLLRPFPKVILVAAGYVGLAALLSSLGFIAYVSSTIPRLFALNRACQDEGYYMAEFEFKMLGFAYQLDRGRALSAASGLRRFHRQLKSRQGLVRVPRFTGPREELEFYLSLQNPRTGAFMDDAAPYFTYDGPTQNVLLHLETLAAATGQPLRLRYPLRYLDEINTPAKLVACLDEVGSVGWIASRLPATSFHFARELLGYAEDGSILERHGLYAFSPEWKRAMLEWFHAFQDPRTGLWGPRSRWTGRLLTLDVHDTASIVKAFVDGEGNDRYPDLPMRHAPQLFASTLEVMSRPRPAAGRLDEWHQWALTNGKGVDLLTRYLWKDASPEHRAAAARLFADHVRITFERYFVPTDGAFSSYPDSRRAALDGTSAGVGLFFALGAYSPERQRRLWGGMERTCSSLGTRSVAALTPADLAPLLEKPDVNSVRVFESEPEEAGLVSSASGVFYPRATQVLDAVELAARVRAWLGSTAPSMGNWVSRQEMSDRLAKAAVEPVPVDRETPFERLNRLLSQNGSVTLVAFDVLQAPRHRITFRRE